MSQGQCACSGRYKKPWHAPRGRRCSRTRARRTTPRGASRCKSTEALQQLASHAKCLPVPATAPGVCTCLPRTEGQQTRSTSGRPRTNLRRPSRTPVLGRSDPRPRVMVYTAGWGTPLASRASLHRSGTAAPPADHLPEPRGSITRPSVTAPAPRALLPGPAPNGRATGLGHSANPMAAPSSEITPPDVPAQQQQEI